MYSWIRERYIKSVNEKKYYTEPANKKNLLRFSIISLVNNSFQAFWLVVWLVNLRHYLLAAGYSSK